VNPLDWIQNEYGVWVPPPEKAKHAGIGFSKDGKLWLPMLPYGYGYSPCTAAIKGGSNIYNSMANMFGMAIKPVEFEMNYDPEVLESLVKSIHGDGYYADRDQKILRVHHKRRFEYVWSDTLKAHVRIGESLKC
jgi:hypothetical protein